MRKCPRLPRADCGQVAIRSNVADPWAFLKIWEGGIGIPMSAVSVGALGACMVAAVTGLFSFCGCGSAGYSAQLRRLAAGR